MKLTPSQRVAVEHRGSNLLVAASAGSGKTEVLARRCLSLVADAAHPCDIDRLLVLTFTRAAAAELRVRIARMLRAEAAKLADTAQRRHLRRQEMLVATADIGTIDSWCGRLVREHFTTANVDVNFTVLGAEDATLLRRRELEALRQWVHQDKDPVAERARAWIARAPQPSDAFLISLVARLSAFREHLVNPEDWLARQRAHAETDDTAAVLAAALAEECAFQHDQLGALAADNGNNEFAALVAYHAALGNWRDRLHDPACLGVIVDEITAFEIQKPRKPRGQPAPEERVELAEVRERWLKKRLQDCWDPKTVATILAHAPVVGPLTLVLLDLEQRYHDQLVDAKRKETKYEFADIQRLALDLLGTPAGPRGRTPTAIARKLQRRYEHILVDEYQDTSPIQVELLRLVTHAAPPAGNRFMVGDVKQSIYGFREAEPRLFSELIEAFAAGREPGCVQYLSDNFRSHCGVLEPLNRLFSLLFDRALGGTGFGTDEALQAGRAELPNPTLDAAPRVTVYAIQAPRERGDTSPSSDTEEPERIEREAQIAADAIRRLLADGVQVLERGADAGPRLRPVRLGDIVILLRSAAKNAAAVARVLRANGIRCVTAGREELLDTLEVRDVVNVLKLLVNRRQDVALAAYLRGPLVGLTDRELLQIRTWTDAREDFFTAVTAAARRNEEMGRRVAVALEQLDEWAHTAREEELPALLQRILHDAALAHFALALPGGVQRVALLRSLERLATGFTAGGQGVAEFVAHLESLAAEEVDPGALAHGDDDVVRIMTIHGSKGLEFPVVLLLGAGNRFNTQSQSAALQCDDGVGFGLRYSDYPLRGNVTSARHFVLREHVRRRELEEELRLLYVATTRAREQLVIIGWTPTDQWDNYRSLYASRGKAPPLIARLGVQTRLEWVLMAAAAGGLHLPQGDAPAAMTLEFCTPDSIHVPDALAAAPDERPAELALSSADEAWVARGRTLVTSPPDDRLGHLPAVLSVSAVKELAARDHEAESTARLTSEHRADVQVIPSLGRPAFASKPGVRDGRTVGSATHRFLQFAEFDRLTDAAAVHRQCANLAAAGLLSADEAALVAADDLVWLAGTPEGRLLATAGDRVRREVPFVYALPLGDTGERAILRGVIDCLVATDDGLVIVDYKTDAPRDQADWAARVASYTVQLQLYAQAAAAIFARPVVRAVLAFVHARRLVDVSLGRPPVAAWLERVAR